MPTSLNSTLSSLQQVNTNLTRDLSAITKRLFDQAYEVKNCLMDALEGD